MTRWTLIYGLLLFLIADSYSQTSSPTAKLYDRNGRLFADIKKKITQRQLTKWMTIEDSLTSKILNRLHYPPILVESVITGQLIISFTVDSNGVFNDFRLEKFKGEMSGEFPGMDIKLFTEICFGSTMLYSRDFFFNGFKSDNNKPDKYYLPIKFSINQNETIRQIKNGWLTFDFTQTTK